MNVAVTAAPDHIPANLLRDIDPWQLLMSAGGSRRHFSFSVGPHHCIGSHLARRELIIAVQEWLARVPPFVADELDKIEMRASGVFGLENLHFR